VFHPGRVDAVQDIASRAGRRRFRSTSVPMLKGRTTTIAATVLRSSMGVATVAGVAPGRI
jgi:hypothetical protein